jgi:hypothetical protein
MQLPLNEPFTDAIAERLRDVLPQQPGHALNDLASMLILPPDAFRHLVEDKAAQIDTSFLIDVVAAFVREFAVDPQWLLVGQYDSTTHRSALKLGENRTEEGNRALRDSVWVQFQRLRDSSAFATTPLHNA